MTVAKQGLLMAAISLLPGAAAAQGGERDSVVYVLSAASRFEVKTGKAGLFGFAGHTHVVGARRVGGRVIFYPNAPASSRVEILVSADSLEVLTPPDTAEIRKVTEAMRTEVLHVDEYPSISFVSTAANPTAEGFHLEGQLTLVGQTRHVVMDVRTGIGADTLRATGSFSVKQSDFGIKPYRGGPAGTVRVADRVTFTFDAVGIRSSGP